MKVTIELDFENEPTRYEVYSYLLELMEDKTLEWRKEEQESPLRGDGNRCKCLSHKGLQPHHKNKSEIELEIELGACYNGASKKILK